MKKHTIGYKEQIKEMGRESDSIITFGETVLGSEELNAVTPSFQSRLLKSAMKQLDIDSNVEIPVGTILNYKFGTKVNGEYEYIDYGNYVVKEVEKQEDTLSYKITCYDKMLYSMKDYVDFGIEYPINVREYINSLCEYLGLKFANVNDKFVNYDKIIPNELYLDENGNSLGYTFRDVFDELAQVTASTICINDNDEVEIRYIKDAINSSIKKGIKIETNDSMDYPVLNYKQYGYTKQNVYSGKNKNVNAENVKAGASNPEGAFTNLEEFDGYKNVIEVNSTISYMTLRTNVMSSDFGQKIASGGIDITTMLLIKKTNVNTKIHFYLGSITGGAVYQDLKHYKDEANGWAWYYTTHTIPASPSDTTINNHIRTAGADFATFYIAKIQTLIGSTPSDFEPYVGGKASPSPYYPQEIEVATGSVSARSTGKNLFNNKSNYTYSNVASSYWTITVLKTGVKLKTTFPTSSPYVRYVITDLTNYVGKKVRIKSNITDSTENRGSYVIGLCAKDSTNATILASASTSGKEVSFIVPELEDNKNYLFAQLYANVVNQNVSGGTVDYTDLIVTIDNEDLTYEPYKESSIQYNLGDNFLADKDYVENGVLNKNIRHLRLAIADMNNNDTFPGWRNVPYIGQDYPEKNAQIRTFCNYKCNIDLSSSYSLSLNSMNGGSTVFINSRLLGLTQTQWKEQYPDLVIDLYYEMPQTEQIQLETTGELRTFEPNTIITNDLDSEMEVEYGNSFDTIDEEYFKDINVNFGEKYGPINSIVLSRAGESDNIYLRDEESIETNGLCELKIKENQIMNFNNRDEFLQGIFEKLNGIEYYLNDFASTGITYYDICDRYKVMIGDKTYSCVMFNDEILVTQGLEENIFTEMPEESETDYTKADKTDRKINQTYIIANKQKGEIESLTSQVRIINNELDNVYTIEQTNRLIQNAETGVTNTFSEAGGNNEFRNTGIWFKNTSEDSETNPYEFWKGKANEGSNDKATNYRSILLGKGSFIQDDVKVPNGNYSISFYYRKLITSAIASVVINDKEYTLDSLETKQFYTGEQNSETGEYIVDPIVVTNNHIKIEFKCDALDGVEVYDLMCNKGSVKLAYSQNQNETTTSTVNISKGITITSSADENTKFKADYDGIRVLDKNNSVKTKFTDKGTETDELVVRKKATITGLLHQEVDDQTWATKI